MASSAGTGGSRHVGRVVDPLAREDGEPEPELELEPSVQSEPDSAAAEEADESEKASSPALPRGRGRAVRERLLAKAAGAREASAEGESKTRNALDEVGRTPLPDGPGAELDAIGAPPRRPPSAPIIPQGGGQLSPTLLAVFGTLMGLATILSLVVLMMSLDRRKALEAPKAGPAASGTGSAAPAVSPPPAKPKRVRNKVPGPWRIADGKNDPGLRFVEGKIGTQAFLKALTEAGVEQAQAYRLLTAFKGVRDFDKCKKSDRFAALIERGTKKLKAFEYSTGPEEVYQAREGADGLLKGIKLDLKVDRAQVKGALVYDGDAFDGSAERGGFDPGLSRVVTKALDGHLSMAELERGDVLRVVAQEVTVLGEFARYAGVEALEIRRVGSKEPLRIYYFDNGEHRGYYDAEGRSPYAGGWRKPVKDAPVTSHFNPKRLHPVLKKPMPHNGTDFGAPTGTPVGAASFGTVSFIGWGGPSGNLVKVQHPGGIETGYAHLSRFAEGLKVGDKVKRLQLVGYIGSTGRSTGPHLHFSAQRDGKFFDAMTLNLDGMRTLTKEERHAFSQVTAKYNPLLDAIPLPDPLPAAEPAKSAEPKPASTPDNSAHDPGAEEEDEAEEATAPPPAPAGPAQAPKETAAPAGPPRTGSAIYLTDKELLQMQSASDDGEVAD